MEFDRVIDAYTLAASDAHYVTSYHWLPWKVPSDKASRDNQDADRHNPAEAQPGLMLMKYVSSDDPATADENYFRLMYVFLIAESPALGTDGAELMNALRYRKELLDVALCRDKDNALRPRCVESRPPAKADSLYVVGPIYSGSAASLRAGLETGLSLDPPAPASTTLARVLITGSTSTSLALDLLNKPLRGAAPKEKEDQYVSYGEPGREELQRFPQLVRRSVLDWYPGRVAIFAEEGTAYGSQAIVHKRKAEQSHDGSVDRKEEEKPSQDNPLVFLFPRGVSVLRNHASPDAGKAQASDGTTPYLQLSLKDTDADDSVEHFGGDNSAVSQESQLIAVMRQLERARTRYVIIEASNTLDAMYLAKFIERACPDAQLVFFSADLLMQHGGDNAPYVGSINLSPYGLIRSSSVTDSAVLKTIPGVQEEAVYNAAAYAFHGATNSQSEAGVDPSDLVNRREDHRVLWSTVAGHDGYYPMGVIAHDEALEGDAQASQANAFLSVQSRNELAAKAVRLLGSRTEISPSLLWYSLSIFASAMCLAQIAVIHSKQFWSEFTGDFVLDKGDQPRRRAVYINIGTAMLWCMTVVLSVPVLAAHQYFTMPWRPDITAGVCLTSGVFVVLVTAFKTRVWFYGGFSLRSARTETGTLYTICNTIALVTAVAVPGLWLYICLHNQVGNELRFVGLFFSYRSLYPGNGVSPVLPVFLLLFAWLLWSLFQIFRLRFSTNARPILPNVVDADIDAYPLYVSDASVKPASNRSSLEERMTCLLITRHLFGSVTEHYPTREAILICAYFLLFGVAVVIFGVQSVERFLLEPGPLPTAYEVLVASLLFPVLMIALAGFLRLMLVWASLRKDVLNALESLPLRFAFTRMNRLSWKAMLSKSGPQERWRDMSRSTESIRQLHNNADLTMALADDLGASDKAKAAWSNLNAHIDDLMKLIARKSTEATSIGTRRVLSGRDLPASPLELALMRAIELDYAAWAEALLSGVLLPYWRSKRTGYVEPEDTAESRASYAADTPKYILVAEEFLAYRYVSLIRAVLVNLRYLMILVLAIFVLAIIAWNSYPFQPRAEVDWIFTALLLLLIGGIVTVLAQMHRNSILSRITDTKPNELGLSFFGKLASLVAVPVLTWLLYHFPDAASTLTRIAQPGISLAK